MPSQTVFRLPTRTGIDCLQSFTESIPNPNPHEVLIKIRAVALNYRDILVATSKYPFPMSDNLIPCSDMAGEIVQVGEEAAAEHELSVDDRVILPLSLALLYGHVKNMRSTLGGPKDGVLREYIVVPGHVIIKVPPGSSQSFEQWAALVTTGSTVWNAFYGYKPLMPGQTVLIQGTGGVSLTALIFAKAAGATTILTSSSDEKLTLVKSKFGVDHTINYNTHRNWAAEVLRITNGEGVDHIIENGGVGTIQQSLESVAWGGVVSTIGYLKAVPKDQMPDVTFLTLTKGAILRGILGGSKQQLEEAASFMASQKLSMPVTKSFPFTRDDIIKAFEYVASGKHIGKICITLD